MLEQRRLAGGSKPRDGVQHRAPLRLRSPLAVLGDREAVGLVAQILEEIQSLRGTRQDEGELVAGDPHFLQALGQAYDGHVRAHGVQGGARGVDLREASVDEHQSSPSTPASSASKREKRRVRTSFIALVSSGVPLPS